ncbi:hypothetical protein TWF506_002500 [Arthrobotrys conoides]|uniref:F-box domain-containing protein n=1 Tax=Arthrobotrys conoides TaxID=74498 RepID=A0AAN8RJU7_9PEZI
MASTSESLYDQAESQALFDESFAECETLCRFYIHIFKSLGLTSTHNEVPDVLISELTKQYVRWANPPAPLHKESVQIPDVPASELRDTHDYIIKWSKRVLDSQLQNRLDNQSDLPIATTASVPTESFVPPTNSEIKRTVKALYHLFLIVLYCEVYIVYPKLEDQSDSCPIHCHELEDPLDCQQEKIARTILEAADCLDLNIIYEILLDSVDSVTKPVISKIKNTTLRDAPLYPCRSRVDSIEWYLAATLGPQGLWKFLFESSFEQQKELYTANIENGFTNPRYYIRSPQSAHGFNGTYPPFLRICRDEFIIGKCDDNWWDDWSTPIGLNDLKAVIWDDWRLKEWGYHLPVIKLPLYLPGQIPFHRIDCELSTPIVPYIERHKKHIHTALLFPEITKFGWANPGGGFMSCKSLQVGDVLGKSTPDLPKFTHPIKSFLPPEVHLLILELADYSQYATLRAVCKTWKAEAWRILKSRYTEPCVLDLKTARESGMNRRYPRDYTIPSPSDYPFLIHPALLSFTGYVRGRLDNSSSLQEFPNTLVVEFGKIYSKPDPDNPLIISSTEQLRAAADYPIIIPNVENPGPLPYTLGTRCSFQCDGYNEGYSTLLAKEDEILKLPRIQSIQAFLGQYYDKFSNIDKLRSPPIGNKPLELFRIGVSKHRLVSSGSPAPGRIEIVFRDPNINYDP